MARSVRAEQAAPVASPVVARRLARSVHPMAWWVWAIGCAVATSLVRNPLLLLLLGAAVWGVVLLRRTTAPWARSTGAYLTMAGAVIAIRLLFQVFMGATTTGVVLFRLPELHLPSWAAGIRLGGPVTLDGVLFTVYDSLRLVVMLLCVGAANSLANPRRALRSVPSALHQVSVAIIIALSVAPQLVDSVQRVRRARRLRGGGNTGLRALGTIVVPVLEDAIDRSILLASGMESRGYGRTRDDRSVGPAAAMSLVGSLVLLANGAFWLLGVVGHHAVGWVLLLAGLALGTLGVRLSGRRLRVTHFRPDTWAAREWLMTAVGVLVAAAVVVLNDRLPDAMTPQTSPPVWPVLDPRMLVVPLLALVPVAVTPPAQEKP